MLLGERREAVASLPGNLGYQALLEDLEHLVNEAVALTVGASTEAATLKAARNLQALWKYFEIMKTGPENIRAEFERERFEIVEMDQNLDPYAPPFPQHRQQMLNEIEQTVKPKRTKK